MMIIIIIVITIITIIIIVIIIILISIMVIIIISVCVCFSVLLLTLAQVALCLNMSAVRHYDGRYEGSRKEKARYEYTADSLAGFVEMTPECLKGAQRA